MTKDARMFVVAHGRDLCRLVQLDTHSQGASRHSSDGSGPVQDADELDRHYRDDGRRSAEAGTARTLSKESFLMAIYAQILSELDPVRGTTGQTIPRRGRNETKQSPSRRRGLWPCRLSLSDPILECRPKLGRSGVRANALDHGAHAVRALRREMLLEAQRAKGAQGVDGENLLRRSIRSPARSRACRRSGDRSSSCQSSLWRSAIGWHRTCHSRRSPSAPDPSSAGAKQRSDEATSLSDLIAGLADLDANGLRLQWRNHLGGTPPAHLPRWLLLRVLGYQIQAA